MRPWFRILVSLLVGTVASLFGVLFAWHAVLSMQPKPPMGDIVAGFVVLGTLFGTIGGVTTFCSLQLDEEDENEIV